MTTSSLKSQINIRSRSLQDVMQAASKTQLELFETLKKQNVALNRTNLLPKMYTSDMLKSSGVESAMDQLRMTLKTTNYNEKYFQHIKNTLETHKKNLMNDLYFNKAQIATDMKSLLNTVVKVQANLHSSINVTNEELPSEIIYEIEEISDHVEETVVALANDTITRREYFERLNHYWDTIATLLVNNKNIVVKTIIAILCSIVFVPVGTALTQKYIIDEFIDKKPETVSGAKNVLKDIPMKKELKTNYRMVIKDTLVVRTSPKTKSNVAYVLDKSAIVFIEEKKKNWSKVLFRNEAGEDQSGWVYTRYIKKLD